MNGWHRNVHEGTLRVYTVIALLIVASNADPARVVPTRVYSVKALDEYPATNAVDGNMLTLYHSTDRVVVSNPFWGMDFVPTFITMVRVWCYGTPTNLELRVWSDTKHNHLVEPVFVGVVARPSGSPPVAVWSVDTLGAKFHITRLTPPGKYYTLEITEVEAWSGQPQTPTPTPSLSVEESGSVRTFTTSVSDTVPTTDTLATSSTATPVFTRSVTRRPSTSWTATLRPTPTATSVPSPPPVRVDPLSAAEGQAVAATGVATAAVSVVSGPGAAVTANRALVSAHLLRCDALIEHGSSGLDAPEFTEHPLQVGLGSGPLAPFRGAAVFNCALVAAAGGTALAVHFTVAAALPHRVMSFVASMLWAVLTTPIFRACAILLRFDEGLWQAVATVVALVAVVAAAGLHVVIVRRVRPSMSNVEDESPVAMSPLQRWLCPMVEWRDARMIQHLQGAHSDAEAEAAPPPYRARLGRFHEDYTAVAFMTWEWVFSAVVGVFAGINPSSQSGCRALATATCVLYVAYAAVCLGRRYFIVRAKALVMCVVAVLQCVGMAAVAWQLFDGVSANTATVVAFCIVLSGVVATLEQIVEAAAWVLYKHDAVLQRITRSDESDPTSTDTAQGDELANPLLQTVPSSEDGGD